MVTATTTSPLKTEFHDAPRVTREEVAAAEPIMPPAEPLDVAAEDPYDNIACTD